MKTTRQSLIVIGSGMAGTAFVEEVLKQDVKRYDLTVFGAERHANYNRVLLSSVLTGEKTVQGITLHGPEWYRENGIRLHAGSAVSAVNRGAKKVITADGLEAGYDRLVFATGSKPVIPDIPGAGLEGVLTFRELDDCQRIMKTADGTKTAVVIGGGLLGLEAAYALKKLGLDVKVIHLMDALMEKQLDRVSSGLLKEDIERLGIEVLLEKEAAEFMGNGRLEGLRFRDGSTIEAGLAVVSIGIRPNAELASSSGLYCNRGIVVSDVMQTYDPAVFAVGECVEHRGATFGLVAPIFEQARVLANQLAGDGRLVFKSRPTSARLKIPSIDLYSAGDVSGPETIDYSDMAGRVFKRVVINDNKIKGIVLYGDSSSGPTLFSSLLSGEDISQRRSMLLLSEAGRPKASASIDSMPDDTVVCGCSGVTKGMIKEAIAKKGLFTREDVKRETKASSSCGGCASTVDRILEATLGSDFRASATESVCACTKYTRDDIIKNIREKRLKSVKEVMETLGWETVGCDACRPAINYYLMMVWPDEAEDDQTSRLVNERMHANIQKDGTFSVVPRMYGGATTPEELMKIARAAMKYDVKLVKVTGGQRLDLIGVRRDDLHNIWHDIGMPSGYAYAKALRTVKTCVGSKYCRYGTQDSLGLGTALEKRLEGLWMPAKVKMSVSGCPRNCSEAHIKDIGIVGITAGGWEVYVGGCGGIELKRAEHLCTAKTMEEVMEMSCAFIQLYREEAHYGERTFKWLRRAGIETVKKILEDRAGRDALLKRLEYALEFTVDPWNAKRAKANSGRAM